MKILVTGGAGFIGSHVAEHFIGEGHEVHIADNLSSGSAANIPDGARFHAVDLRHAAFPRLIEKEQFPAIVHHAAQLDVRRSVADPVFDADVNILGFLRMMECGRRNGLERIVFASTGGAIYGETDELPQDEANTLQPESPYGIAKLATEKYLYFYEQVHGIKPVILRYANVYGPRQGAYGEAGVIAIFIKKILAGETPIVFGDGEQTRDYVFVGDVVKANHLALDSPAGGTYNIGTGVETSVNRLLAMLQQALGQSFSATYAEERPGEVRRSALSYAAARLNLGWEPETDLARGIDLTVEWFNNSRT